MTLNRFACCFASSLFVLLANLSHSAISYSQEEAPSQVQQRLWWDKFETSTQRISSFDGTELSSVLYTPKEYYFPGQRPGIIFANSWALDENEYFIQARKFAEQGYIVLSYATRGFSSSSGKVDVAGPKDQADISSVIDWLQANTRLDVNRLGFAGVSYGAGIALMGAAKDSRIKAVASMSGWGNLEQALYGNETIREVWVDLLIGAGTLLGRLDPIVYQQIKRLRNNTDVDAVKTWAAQRSPLSFIDKINERKVPIFLANSYQDGLFPPSQIRSFYEQLQGPKAFYLDNGIHAVSAAPGLLGLPSPLWDEVHQWFDRWLRDPSNTKKTPDSISFQTQKGREYYTSFPNLVSSRSKLPLKPVDGISDNGLELDLDRSTNMISFQGGVDSGATTGIPLLSDTADAILDKPVITQLSLIDRRYAAVYTTEIQNQAQHLRGSPQVKLWIAHTQLNCSKRAIK
ncbi:MAG: hypothetical protein NTX25_17770 [Proteobacteria bacterium]|nr:hypothetical protein [Pseudomonadota bacterium]